MTAIENRWLCSVKVATVWTEPSSARELDAPGLSNPVLLAEWLEVLPYKERLALCDENRIQTQLLYGEPVIVEKVEGDWAKIIAVWQPSKKDSRGYPGWVPVAQLSQLEQVDSIGFARVTSARAQLWDVQEKPLIVVPFNTTLPVITEDPSYFRIQTPHGAALLRKKDAEFASTLDKFPKRSAEEAVQLGEAFLDLPYLWGGMSPYGYDCSGFSYNMLKACGFLIPRDASDQSLSGDGVSLHDPSLWKKGDLIFFANDEGKGSVRHVGFYYGNGQLLHSPSTGKTIEITVIEGSKLEKEICAVRRFVF